MNEWTSGYVADIDYTYGYYAELNPLRYKLALMNAAVKGNQLKTACELGFGQGMSINMHAAATETKWYGTDFNPAQAGFARELAETCGNGANLYDESFEEFCARDDLPDFDYIALHGIWSWISDDNRAVIVDFLRRKLRVGGILYVSYNTMPGWASFAPMRNLMVQHAEVVGSEGRGIVSRIDGAVGFAQALMETNPAYKLANPQADVRLRSINDKNRNYLAHEFFNKDWDPIHFAQMAGWLGPAKLDFACSANLLEHINATNFSEQQQAFINGIPDRMLRESTKDFMINQTFRRDYWTKGLRKHPKIERNEELSKLRVILATPKEEVSLKIETSQGEASLNENVYQPILEQLSNHKPQTLGTLADAVIAGDSNISSGAIVEAVMVLASLNHLFPIQAENDIKKSKVKTDKLNALLMSKARSSSELAYLCSPVIGGGFPVSRIEQLFLSEFKSGTKNPAQIAEVTCNLLFNQGERMLREGKTLDSLEENQEELTTRAQDFLSKQLPILEVLKI